jgi:hypothetical protein
VEAPVRKGLRIGIDWGGTNVKLALVNEKGRCLEVKQIPTVKDLKKLCMVLRTEAGEWMKRPILGCGVGVAGDVDGDRGVVRFAPNLRWRNVPIGKHLRAAGFPAPLRVENDATAAACCEAASAPGSIFGLPHFSQHYRDRGCIHPCGFHQARGFTEIIRINRLEELVDPVDRGQLFEDQSSFKVGFVHFRFPFLVQLALWRT